MLTRVCCPIALALLTALSAAAAERAATLPADTVGCLDRVWLRLYQKAEDTGDMMLWTQAMTKGCFQLDGWRYRVVEQGPESSLIEVPEFLYRRAYVSNVKLGLARPRTATPAPSEAALITARRGAVACLEEALVRRLTAAMRASDRQALAALMTNGCFQIAGERYAVVEAGPQISRIHVPGHRHPDLYAHNGFLRPLEPTPPGGASQGAGPAGMPGGMLR